MHVLDNHSRLFQQKKHKITIKAVKNRQYKSSRIWCYSARNVLILDTHMLAIHAELLILKHVFCAKKNPQNGKKKKLTEVWSQEKSEPKWGIYKSNITPQKIIFLRKNTHKTHVHSPPLQSEHDPDKKKCKWNYGNCQYHHFFFRLVQRWTFPTRFGGFAFWS